MARIDVSYESGCTRQAFDEASPCPRCESMHFFWVNRNGGTLCAGCDEEVSRESEG